MLDKLAEVEKRYTQLESLMSDPSLPGKSREYSKIAKERSDLEELVLCYRDWKKTEQEIESNKELLGEPDEAMREMAKEELALLRERKEQLEARLKYLLLPKDPNDSRNVIFEIRAGTGGDEAALFAAELSRMYTRYAENRGWRVEIMSSNPTGLGGLKEIILLVEGKGAYSRLKFEGGVHRVQRVPVTEGSGRIHTSTVTVAVLPEADEVEVNIDPKDLKVDVMRASGPGGAHDVDLQILGVDIYLDLVRFGQHRDGDSGGVNAPGALRDRDALHAVHAALELEPAVSALALDEQNNFFESAQAGRVRAHDLDAPAAVLGVARVHARELGREQCRLVAAGAGANLKDHVPAVVGVFRQQKVFEARFELFFALAEQRELLLRHLAHRLVRLAEQLLVRFDLLLGLLPVAIAEDELFEVRALLGDLGVFARFPRKRRIAHEAFELRITLFDFCEFVEHGLYGPLGPLEIKKGKGP